MPFHRSIPAFAFLLPVVALSTTLPAQGNDGSSWPHVRNLDQDIRLDGRLDEPDWALTDSVWEFRTKEPTEGGTPSERTVVRMLATPKGLAIGWWNYDRDVASRRHSQLRRDVELRFDDYVSVMIDGLRDRRSAFYFRVNSNGALWDGEHINFQIGNESWDGIWDARAAVEDWGWTAEMLIPWTTLRYPKDATAMGINFRRFLPRTNEEVLWRAWKHGQGYRFLDDEGTVEGFRTLPPRARAELRPFVASEVRLPDRQFMADGQDIRLADGKMSASAGLDAKLPVTSTLTADLTAFPDFAQVEVDRQIANLTRFPLFFPEQRTFFTEGAAIFGFGTPQQAQLFYSRRIGLGAGGTPVAIPFGARMQGRTGPYQIGLLAVRTGDDEKATDLVARVRHDVLSRGYVGAMATYSDRAAQPQALGGGVDFELPFFLNDRHNLIFSGNAAFSRDSTGAPAGSHYRFMADYPNDKADVVLSYDRIDDAYAPALGFVTQAGIHRLSGHASVTPRPRDAKVIRRWDFSLLDYNMVWSLDGRLDNAKYSIRPIGAQLQNGDSWQLNLQRVVDAPTVPFGLVPGTTIAPGRYEWNRVEVRYTGTKTRLWRLTGYANTGGFYNGRGTDVSITGDLRLQPHMEFNLDLVRQEGTFPSSKFVVHTVRFRGDYAFTPRLTASAFVQYDDKSDRAAANARVRWTTSPGSDLYVVWNNAWNTGLESGIPWSRPLQGALVAKYVRFFRM